MRASHIVRSFEANFGLKLLGMSGFLCFLGALLPCKSGLQWVVPSVNTATQGELA